MNKIEKFVKTSGIYFFGNVFNKLISFLLLPLYTNRISPDSYGTYGLVQSLINLIIPIVFIQIWDGVFRYSFDYTSDEDKYDVISNGFIIILLGIIIYSISFGVFSYIVNIEYKILIFLYSIGIGIQYYYGVIARSLQKNSLYVISGSINSFLTIIFNLIFILAFNMGIDSLYASSVIGILVQVLIIEYRLRPISKFNINKINFNLIKKMTSFSTPLSISTITQWLLTGLTQVAISLYIGTYANGLYTVANKFSSILILFSGVFQFAWNETAYDLANDENKKKYYSKGLNEFLRVTLFGSSIFILIIKLIFPNFIDSQYSDALELVPIVLLGTTANSYSGFLGTIFLANKNSKNLTAATIISSIANIIGLIILIPLWGLYGAVLSLCIAFFIGMISRLIMLNKIEGIKLENYAYKPLILLGISILTFYKIENESYLLLLLCIIVVIALFSLKSLVRALLNIAKRLVM